MWGATSCIPVLTSLPDMLPVDKEHLFFFTMLTLRWKQEAVLVKVVFRYFSETDQGRSFEFRQIYQAF